MRPFWVRFWRPLRRASQRRSHRVIDVQVHGLEHLLKAISKDQGVLITPNHPGSADPHIMYHVADQAGCPFYFMAAWQLFGDSPWLVRHVLRKHGVFSVNREGTDLRAFKQAVEILVTRKYPLVVFPEGEVYHINDRVTPFREGAAAIALAAVRRSDHPVTVIPAGIKYHYLEDPTPMLTKIMDELEQQIFWRPRRELPLADRIYAFAEGPLTLKELEYMGRTCAGPLPDRIAALSRFILDYLESRHGKSDSESTTPERIKALRQRLLKKLKDLSEADPHQQQCLEDLDDLLFVVQLFSYPGDYVADSPTIERIAETIDKFAEDVLGKRRASVCAARQVTVVLDRPVVVADEQDRKLVTTSLTSMLEERVQTLLDKMPSPAQRPIDDPVST